MKKFFRFLFRLLFWFFLLSVSWVIVYRFLPTPGTYLMLQRMAEQSMEKKRNIQIVKTWKPLTEISPQLPLAVMASEDQRFFIHDGLDFDAIEKAQEYNQKQQRKGKNKRRGASTISQQTAKNVFLWPGRSWLRKGFEVYFTLLIEFFWPKYRIMEMYLNVAEWGDGIYGAEAASQYFFDKPAAKLSRSEAALLAAVLPNPLRWSPSRPTPYIRKRQGWIIGQMNQLPPLDWEQETKK
jgi:monofunctional biosynthetic peptidoglycan transglycosylase